MTIRRHVMPWLRMALGRCSPAGLLVVALLWSVPAFAVTSAELRKQILDELQGYAKDGNAEWGRLAQRLQQEVTSNENGVLELAGVIERIPGDGKSNHLSELVAAYGDAL